MAINDDIVWHYSGSGTSISSLGGAIHTNTIASSIDQNIFQNIDSAEAIAGSEKYVCLFIKNTGVVTYTLVGVYIEQETLSPSTKIYVSAGLSGINGTEQTIANVSTEPTGLIWQRPTQSYIAVSIPDMAPGASHALWLRRSLLANAAGSVSDYCRLAMVGQ